ncbi:MAG: prolyl oligopeptidase family serine peptidase [Prosthecobacter sp.]|uniref:alpha/beta hydrolase family protein n=1 Tax=Prosthecobacter sp. TaxID=1965333 RepID=UPI003BAE7E4C
MKFLPTGLSVLLLFTAAVQAQSPAASSSPNIPTGMVRKEYQITGNGNQVWVYHPSIMKEDSIPCILIAAAGTRMFHGMDLGDGDVPEHLPYVKAGFAVVAYSLSGPWPADPVTDAGVIKASTTFIQSQGGLNDAIAALQLAKEKHPFLSNSHVYAAGHSSAGVVALNLAQKLPLLRGCIAYAPAPDLEQRFGAKVISQLDTGITGFRKFVEENSPFRNAEQIHCPVLVFNALDDSKIPPVTIHAYVERLQKAGKTVKHVEVPTGDHYDSMLNEGIPQGIQWIKTLEAAGSKP